MLESIEWGAIVGTLAHFTPSSLSRPWGLGGDRDLAECFKRLIPPPHRPPIRSTLLIVAMLLARPGGGAPESTPTRRAATRRIRSFRAVPFPLSEYPAAGLALACTAGLVEQLRVS